MWNPSDYKNMPEDELKSFLLTCTPPNLPLHNLGDPYKPINFVDHIPDLETGEIIMRGTPLSRRTFGYMDEALHHLYLQVFTLYKLIRIMPLDVGDLESPFLSYMTVDAGNFTDDSLLIDCGGFDTSVNQYPAIDAGDFN